MAFVQKMICDNCQEDHDVPPEEISASETIDDYVPTGWYKGPLPLPGSPEEVGTERNEARIEPEVLICNACIWAIDSALKQRRKGTRHKRIGATRERPRTEQTNERSDGGDRPPEKRDQDSPG